MMKSSVCGDGSACKKVNEMSVAVQERLSHIELIQKERKRVEIFEVDKCAEAVVDLAKEARLLNDVINDVMVPRRCCGSALVFARSLIKSSHRHLNEWGVTGFVDQLETTSVGLFGISLAQMIAR